MDYALRPVLRMPCCCLTSAGKTPMRMAVVAVEETPCARDDLRPRAPKYMISKVAQTPHPGRS